MSLVIKDIAKSRCKVFRMLTLVVALMIGCRERAPQDVVDFPARDTPNYQGLVSVHWLRRLLDYQESPSQKPRPETYLRDRFVVLEASWATLTDAKEYHTGHIPGAYHFNTDELENGYPRWRLRDAIDLQHSIGRAGITPDTTVIVYGEKLTAAARVWWALKYAGVSDVRLLDGGFEAWSSAGYPVDNTNIPQPVSFEAPIAAHILATTEYVRERLESSGLWLADVRSESEFTGRASGYSYLDAKGRIVSAVSVGDGGDDAFIYMQPDGRLRTPEEILDLWRKQGIVPTNDGGRFEREVVFYCGGGWRSSVAFFYAWLLGLENIRNYSDGWSGWSTEYRPDADSKGSTPAWKQIRTTNPIEPG